MVNVGVIILIVTIIIFILLGIGLLSWALVSRARYNELHPGEPGTPLPPCSESINISDLIQIPTDMAPNCIKGAPYYYIGNLGDKSYDYVVSSWPTQIINVCLHFCDTLVDGVCTGGIYNGRTAQENFDSCMKQLKPNPTCSPPDPIAAKGPLLYYAFSPTCSVCDNCTGT
jgi:hypothetical protein